MSRKYRFFYPGLPLVMLISLQLRAQCTACPEYRFDASASRIELAVSKEGIFKAFGHDHLISARSFSGEAHFQPDRFAESSVMIRVDAKALAVLDPGESDKTRAEVQAAMQGPQVLNVEAFPAITFTSTAAKQAKASGGQWEAVLTGRLNLHGTIREISFPVLLRLEKGVLYAQGEALISQTEFGITPIKIAGGAVRVKDRIKVRFYLAGASTKS